MKEWELDKRGCSCLNSLYMRAQTAKNLADVENNWAIYESECIHVLEYT